MRGVRERDTSLVAEDSHAPSQVEKHQKKTGTTGIRQTTGKNMSDKQRKWIEVVAVCAGLATGLAGMFGAFFLIPYRMSAVETRVEKIAQQRDTDRELLLRIEERLISVQRELMRSPK
jgi:hypothetical protein